MQYTIHNLSQAPTDSGIYQITCTPTGKIYIGSAKNIRNRWNRHVYSLRNKVHGNRYMQSAWLKHGESAFMFMVLEDTSIESLIDREQYHINIKQPYVRSIGFNIAHVTGSSLGVKHSTKTRQRISGLMQGKSRSEESNRLTSESMRGHVVSNETRRKLSERHREKRPSDATIASVSKTWIFTDPNGVEQTVVGAISFCKEHGLDANRMYEVAGGKRTNYKGWRCRKA